jgi:hypothetical protein
MRYTVRYYNGKDIINDSHTNCHDTAYNRERELREIYGRENVWIADAIMEILVG